MGLTWALYFRMLGELIIWWRALETPMLLRITPSQALSRMLYPLHLEILSKQSAADSAVNLTKIIELYDQIVLYR